MSRPDRVRVNGRIESSEKERFRGEIKVELEWEPEKERYRSFSENRDNKQNEDNQQNDVNSTDKN